MDDDFQKFFSTIAEATVFATLLVFFGKYLTDAYLFLFLGIVTLAIFGIEGYRYEEVRRKDRALRHLKDSLQHQINQQTMNRRERQSIVKAKTRDSSSSTEIAAKKKNKKESNNKRSPKTLFTRSTHLAKNNNDNSNSNSNNGNNNSNNNSNNNNNNNSHADGEEVVTPVSILKHKVNLRQRIKSKMERAIEKTKRKSLPANFLENNQLSNSNSRINHKSVEILDNGWTQK